jgi:polyhydroxyalkanoate synthesis regulator phasin
MPAEAKAKGWMDELVETIKERSKSWPEDLRSQLEAGLQKIRQESAAEEKADKTNNAHERAG